MVFLVFCVSDTGPCRSTIFLVLCLLREALPEHVVALHSSFRPPPIYLGKRLSS